MFSLRSVSFTYGQNTTACDAVQGVVIDALDTPKTGITAIIGPSGSGKSTLLSILAGFVPPTIGEGGHLRFGDEDARGGGHAAGDVAFVFQSSMLLGAASGAANMLQGRVAAGTAGRPPTLAETRRLLRTLGLLDTEHTLLAKRTRLLSGGEAQRFAVMRALLTGARAILCDEPTSSLDRENADAVMLALQHWSQSSGRPVLWVTHDLDLASRYADHFVFLSRGRIARPDGETAEALDAGEPERRRAALEGFARKLDCRGIRTASGDDADRDAATLDVGKSTYAHWIANALSTDRPGAVRVEDVRADPLMPLGLQALIGRVDPGFALPATGRIRYWFRTIVGFPLRYSGWGLAIVLTVLLTQMFLALMLGRTATVYSDVRLQDPAVARIVFEHEIVLDSERRGIGTAERLYAATTLVAIRDAIRDGLSRSDLARGDPDRVKVFGRRTVPRSEIRFSEGRDGCGEWTALDTVALDRDDPLLRQTELVGAGVSQARIAAIAQRATESAGLADAPALAILDVRIVELLRRHCGFAFDGPVEVEWAAVDANGRSAPVRLEIVGVARQMPPLHPAPAQLLVLEQDVQRIANRGEMPPEPFRIATAYFPISGFETAKTVLHARGYVIRDDSEAAVRTLQQIATAADWLPSGLVALNFFCLGFIVFIVVNGLLERNKRVLALFRAHGFGQLDMLKVMTLHLAPGLALALAALLVAIHVSWPALRAVVPDDFGSMEPHRDLAFLYTSLIAIVCWLFSVLVTVGSWWHSMGKRLTKYLQD
ncbi:ATP-binding cassette domain-containing protein [Blastochloris sulfoviridis]|nr:ATP-binding cassette domain-containing protein [Blastochloris sulfoviridis]